MPEATPLQQIIDALVPLVTTLVGLIFAWLTATIRSKVKSEQARGILLRLSEQASDVVLELEQTMAGHLRAAAKDGRLDAVDVADLKAAALANLKAYLGERGKADALKALGFKDEAELENLLRAKIEAEVAKVKANIGAKLKAALETPPKPAGVT